jgi:hypothetical protein
MTQAETDMATLARTHALIDELAHTIGLDGLPPEPEGGWHLSIGEADDVYLYGGGEDDELIVVMPIAPLPSTPSFAAMQYLLRTNLFDSDASPFQIATDESAMVVQWGRLDIADLTGATLARIIDNLAERADTIRTHLQTKA